MTVPGTPAGVAMGSSDSILRQLRRAAEAADATGAHRQIAVRLCDDERTPEVIVSTIFDAISQSGTPRQRKQEMLESARQWIVLIVPTTHQKDVLAEYDRTIEGRRAAMAVGVRMPTHQRILRFITWCCLSSALAAQIALIAQVILRRSASGLWGYFAVIAIGLAGFAAVQFFGRLAFTKWQHRTLDVFAALAVIGFLVAAMFQ